MSRLTDLADVLRAAGVPVVEVEGWQTRGRGGDGGQYQPGRPNHVMVHHTAGASGASASSEVNYMVNVSDVAPVSNLYISRDKDNAAVWIMAAGPTNTNGKGSAPWDPATKTDDMNRMAIGIELGNNGVGEPYGTKQQETLIAVCAALCEAYSIPVGHVRSHAEWSPGRKIDPAGPSQWATSGTWPMDAFRETIAGALGTTPPPASPDRVKAVPGDGGYSLMRKLGIDPTDHKAARDFYDRNFVVYSDIWVYKP